MSDPETMPTGVHPEVALLPWYVNGTLDDVERQQVARHIESCSDCRRELDEITQIKRELKAIYGAQAEAPPSLARSVMARVSAERTVKEDRRHEGMSSLRGIDQWFRSLFLPQWIPTVAAMLIVIQAGLLMWVTFPSTRQDQILSRSVGSPVIKFRVVFKGESTEAQTRELLTLIRGRVIDGPDASHAYTIEVLGDDPTIGMKALETLRTRNDLIRTAEIMAP